MTGASLLLLFEAAAFGALFGAAAGLLWLRAVLPRLSLHRGLPPSHAAAVIAELVSSEAAFVARLRAFLDVFAPAIREYDADGGALWRACGGFAAVGVLAELHARLLADLRRARGARSGVAAALTALAPFLKLHVQFAAAHAAMSGAFAAERARTPAFAALLRRCSSDARVGGHSAESLLIAPVQRLPRYVLLLAELRRQTPRAHSAYGAVCRALRDVRAAAERLNECKRALEHDTLLHELQEASVGLPEPLLAPQRRVLRVGSARIVGGGGRQLLTEFLAQEATLVLCSDVLVVLCPLPGAGSSLLRRMRYVVRAFVRRDLIESVVPVSGGSRGGRFEVHWKQDGWLRIATSSPDERQSWLKSLEQF